MRIAPAIAALSALAGSLVLAVVPGIAAGDLIKVKNDGNPFTDHDEVVYFVDRDLKRHPFPNKDVLESWYDGDVAPKELTAEQVASFGLGAPVRYRFGTRLVQFTGVPGTYAVEPGGTLRAIASAEVGRDLYGAAWQSRIDSVDDAFITSYGLGVPLVLPVWPTGTVVRRASDDAVFLIDGRQKRGLTPPDLTALRVSARNAVVTEGDLTEYAVAEPLAAVDPRLLDAAELETIGTEPTLTVDFPDAVARLTPGQDSVLASFRVTTGAAARLQGLTVVFPGLLAEQISTLAGVHVTDAAGNDLMGEQQLTMDSSGRASVVFGGSFVLPGRTQTVVQIRATVPVTVPSGTSYAVSIPRDGMTFVEEGSGLPLHFWHPTSAFSRAK